MTTYCFYHRRDLDGKCSGAIVNSKFANLQLIGIDYGDEFPWNIIKQDDLAYMVDFSLPSEDMATLNSRCNLVWIDHHISAIKDSGSLGIAGLQIDGKAGCELTWEFLFPDQPMPEAVRLLGRYDVWDHTDPDTLIFQIGCKMYDLEPASGLWFKLFANDKDSLAQILMEGELLNRYQALQNTDMCKSNSFEVRFEGLNCIAMNGGLGLQIFDSVWCDKYDMMITFSTNGEQWRVSLYQTGRENVDCSVIAKKYGGGGHKGAAGFQCKELPFSIVEIN